MLALLLALSIHTPALAAENCPDFSGEYRCTYKGESEPRLMRVKKKPGGFEFDGESVTMYLNVNGGPSGMEGYMFKAPLSASCTEDGIRVSSVEKKGMSAWYFKTPEGYVVKGLEKVEVCKKLNEN